MFCVVDKQHKHSSISSEYLFYIVPKTMAEITIGRMRKYYYIEILRLTGVHKTDCVQNLLMHGHECE